MSQQQRRGYTLTEMLVALGVGMVVMQIAFTSFFFIQKFVRRIDRVDGMNQVAQAAVLWTIGKPSKATLYPRGAQISQVGVPLDADVSPAKGVDPDTVNHRVTYMIRDYQMKNIYPTRDCDNLLLLPVQEP